MKSKNQILFGPLLEQAHINEMDEIKKKFLVLDNEGKQVIPMPTNNMDALRQLKELYGTVWFCIDKFHFLQNNKNRMKHTNTIIRLLQEEIRELDEFITEAERRGLKDERGRATLNQYQFYLRLKYGFYLDNKIENEDLGYGTPLARVYGRCFLFYDFLKDQLGKLKCAPADGAGMFTRLSSLESNSGDNIANSKSQFNYGKRIKGECTCRQRALQYYFMQASNEVEGYKTGEKEKWLKEKSDALKVDRQNFKKYFLEAEAGKKMLSPSKNNIDDLIETCGLLSDMPKALLLAKEKLEAAKANHK